MTFAAATPLHDLGTLVFGEHALHLQEQVFLRADADRAIQKRDLDAVLREFVHQQHLIRVAPREAIGRMHVQLLKAADVGRVAQAFQRRPQERRAAHALIQKTKFFGQFKTIVRDALPKRRHLTGDRLLLRLLLRRHPRIDRDPHC